MTIVPQPGKFTDPDDDVGPFCLDCGSPVEFQGFLGAPGIGRSYKCTHTEKHSNGEEKYFIMLHGILLDPVEYAKDMNPPWILRAVDENVSSG